MPRRAWSYRDYFLLNVNPVIRFLIISDVVWNSAVGLLGPIFSLFIVDFIEGGSPAVAGVSATIYLVTKSVLQIPIASFIDKMRGEKDDFWILFIGSLVAALTPLLYLIIHTPAQLYAVQFVSGIAIAFTFPSYMAIYTRHIDKNQEGTEWGVYFTLTDMSAALAAVLGGVIAETSGFRPLIVVVVTVSILGVLLMYPIKPYLRTGRRGVRLGV